MKKYENNSFTIKNVGEIVTLYGWANKTRNLGGVIFIDLRDRSGIIQLAIKPDNKCYNQALEIKKLQAELKTVIDTNVEKLVESSPKKEKEKKKNKN